jgi:DNA mismatch repair protein MutS
MSVHPPPPIDFADTRLTPMMAQYMEIKAANADSLLFYRMGDFYEMFFEDAQIASRTLGITLTKRGKHLGEDIPMCGVPVERADDYLQRLISAGHRVAVAEQLEDPAEAKKRGSKSVVKRDVVRLVTSGTLTEENLLNPSHANLLVALARVSADNASEQGVWEYGVAAVDISTGRFDVSVVSAHELSSELARLDPKELVLTRAIHDDPALSALWIEFNVPRVPVANDVCDSSQAQERICAFYEVMSLEAFGTFTRTELAAMGLVLFYIERTQRGARPVLSPPKRAHKGGVLLIDAATRANLELTKTLSGERVGSLLATIDRTLTSGGGRLLAEHLAGPLTDVTSLNKRHESVAFWANNIPLCTKLREALKALPDIERCLGRIALDRAGPRDLNAIAQGLSGAQNLSHLLSQHVDIPERVQEALNPLMQVDAGLMTRLNASLLESPPLLKRDGGFIKEGYESELDECRVLQHDSRRYIAALQARYAHETGCRQLKIKHNHMIGYFVEVPQNNGEEFLQEPWRALFVHRQTMAGAMRFSTVELGDLEARIAQASGRALAIEHRIFGELVCDILEQVISLKAIAASFAQLDVMSALACVAVEQSWVCPVLDRSLAFDIIGGRHPVVEAALHKQGQAFIANGCTLSPPVEASTVRGCIRLITGPNMAGKSTYLRQNALIVILAQMGSFVPAQHAHMGIVDQVFSRVGAADDLARGRSTFMVEMMETATILNQATAHSLVILDEIGRGTATFDGLSLAWASVEHLHENIGCRALFATHFHELTALAKRLPRLHNASMKVTDWQGDVVFLHEVVKGAASRSYGIHVAKRAGLPASVIARAEVLLHELEKNDRERPNVRLVDDLPLFAVAAHAEVKTAQVKSLSEPIADPLRETLKALTLDEMTPKQALETLYELKKAL